MVQTCCSSEGVMFEEVRGKCELFRSQAVSFLGTEFLLPM